MRQGETHTFVYLTDEESIRYAARFVMDCKCGNCRPAGDPFMKIQYQFTTDENDQEHPVMAACWPVRDTWEEAAADAVAAGYAHWENDAALVLHEERGARIRNIRS